MDIETDEEKSLCNQKLWGWPMLLRWSRPETTQHCTWWMGCRTTFFNRTNLDELAGPFRMDVRAHPAGGSDQQSVDRAGAFDVARAFFTAHLA
jgi:hypothetical protein